jgi:tRNA(adenine34) deaminase
MIIEYERHFLFIQNIFYLSKIKENNEVPVSSMVTLNNNIIGVGYNNMISSNNPNNHAEIIALKKASLNIRSFYLKKATIYITQEPCIMCIESIMNYKIRNIVYGYCSKNKNKWNYLKYLVQKGELDIVINIKEKKCKNTLKDFFLLKR